MSNTLLGGRYQLQEVLGRGGMAAVWRGVDVRLDRPVAVKMLDGARLADPAALERFDREARTVARLTHPNIVSVYDVGEDHGAPYLVMELVEGDSLAAMLAGGPLDIRQAVMIAAQVCDALAEAHAAGVVHRDIKPANILLTPAGRVKVCDFGIARLQYAATTEASLTGPAAAIGTSEYMAPEQAAGDPVDARTDLYALGCVLYAMLTGAPPFTGGDPLGVVYQHIHRPPPPLRSYRADIPAALDALVDGLLAKNPGDRPADARQTLARLVVPADLPTAEILSSPIAPGRTDPPPVRSTAAAVSRTAVLPAAGPEADRVVSSPAASSFRVGPAGIVAVAIGAAVLAAVVVATLVAGGSTAPEAGPPSGSSASTLPTITTAATSAPESIIGSAGQVSAVRATIQQQADAGQIDTKAAKDLSKKLDEIERDLAKGEIAKAAEKVAELRTTLTELHEDDMITATGLDAVTQSLDILAETLPTPENEEDD